MRSVEVACDRIPRWFANFAERNGGTPLVEATELGVRATAPNGTVAEATVPFAYAWKPDDDPVAALHDHAAQPRTVGVLLVRIGGFAAGVFDGAALREGKAGSRHVQGRSAAGGWSQQRFARRRAAQADAAFEAAADYAVRILLPVAADLEALVLGGERRAVDAVLADRRLTPLRSVPTEPGFLTVPDPTRTVLLATPAAFRSLRIVLTDPPAPGCAR
ncbi:MAG: acVLRF1 family peptidyl-tRNA hydrolase [Sporichthyaceae bacterium]